LASAICIVATTRNAALLKGATYHRRTTVRINIAGLIYIATTYIGCNITAKTTTSLVKTDETIFEKALAGARWYDAVEITTAVVGTTVESWRACDACRITT
jgi:hypothetical protein